MTKHPPFQVLYSLFAPLLSPPTPTMLASVPTGAPDSLSSFFKTAVAWKSPLETFLTLDPSKINRTLFVAWQSRAIFAPKISVHI